MSKEEKISKYLSTESRVNHNNSTAKKMKQKVEYIPNYVTIRKALRCSSNSCRSLQTNTNTCQRCMLAIITIITVTKCE